MKPRILIFCDYYLPGIKGGGGMWAIKNIIDRFSNVYDFFVVTKNHDGKSDLTPYTAVQTGKWNDLGNASVFYLAPKDLTSRRVANLVNEIKPNAIFLNSILSTPVVKFLVARRLRLFTPIPVILASCGELSSATLRLKRLKKSIYLKIATVLKLYEGLIWRASFAEEKAEIQTMFGSQEIYIAPDLTPKAILSESSFADKPVKSPGHAKFIFVSRIVRQKNLLFFLKILKQCNTGKIELEIVGPTENLNYWKECLDSVAKLGKNIEVSVSGAVSNAKALERLTNSHFFVLPTLNENFGYVCIEALAAGCPLLLSNRTNWSDLQKRGLGWNIMLENKQDWIDAVKSAVDMDAPIFEKMSRNARKFAIEWLADHSIEKATADLLKLAVSRSR